MARRSGIKVIRCDNGSNMVGAERESAAFLKDVDKGTIEIWGAKCGIKWIFNPPKASHFGGVWERQIRSFR